MQGFEGCRPSHRKSAGRFKKGRALWVQGTKRNAKRDAALDKYSASSETLSKLTRNPSRKLIDITPCPQAPKLAVTSSPQPSKPKTV